jgi:hypothetical protein
MYETNVMCNFDFADKLEANADYSSLADNSWTIRSAIRLERQKNPVRANLQLIPYSSSSFVSMVLSYLSDRSEREAEESLETEVLSSLFSCSSTLHNES